MNVTNHAHRGLAGGVNSGDKRSKPIVTEVFFDGAWTDSAIREKIETEPKI
jgi:hypothetical protein